ncbi:hypothetical protein SLS62_005293 [Diatrype stigma]|uniref:Large ribosomal subunit protein mL54 n=1 Tax=Diatrype stigma TaxID=117547 RepID=A0AAN9URM6_9PEZI
MICRRCLQRASGSLVAATPRRRPSPPSISISQPASTATSAIRSRLPITTRPFSHSTRARSSSPAPSPPSGEPPALSTPLGPADGSSSSGGGEAPVSKSTCPPGTVLTGLNYFKGREDPVALADADYPDWLWDCLSVQKKADAAADDEAGDEFSKSKKQRKLAAKRQRNLEAKLLAEGNIEALAPKIPLQHQSINLPANEEGTEAGALAAVAAREELRSAMRRARKANIKEQNYLKSM